MTVIEDLRSAIDVKHQEALRALEILKSYLDAPDLPANGAANAKPLEYQSIFQQPTLSGSHREKVIAALTGVSRSVRDVSAETGLTPKQIRGVIGAPDLKSCFESEDRMGVRYYQYRDQRESAS